MEMRHPAMASETHEVTNQPPPLAEFNRFRSDRALQDAVIRSGAGSHAERLDGFGEKTGSDEVIGWGEDANQNPPWLETHDRFGHRIDEVRFHPSYHQLMSLGLDEGVAAVHARRRGADVGAPATSTSRHCNP